MDVFQNVLARKATEADLDTVGDLAELLKNCKCTLCQSATVPVFDAVTHYRADFLAYINEACGPNTEKADYIHKITAPCMDKCPAHIDIPKYIEEIKNYQYAEALATIRENMPMPSVCGRVCPHPCETACRRKNVDDAINIMVLKRTASDYEWQHNSPRPCSPNRPKTRRSPSSAPALPAWPAPTTWGWKATRSTIYRSPARRVRRRHDRRRHPRLPHAAPILQRDVDIIASVGSRSSTTRGSARISPWPS